MSLKLTVLNSLRTTIVSHVRDWGAEKRDAWIYGVIVGWGLKYSDRPDGLKDCKREDWDRMNLYHQVLWDENVRL